MKLKNCSKIWNSIFFELFYYVNFFQRNTNNKKLDLKLMIKIYGQINN